MRSFYLRGALYVATAFLLLLSCKKSGVDTRQQVAASSGLVSASPSPKVERMRTFLSATLNVDREKIVYQPERQEYVVLGAIKFDYASVEGRYDEANEYKLKYE